MGSVSKVQRPPQPFYLDGKYEHRNEHVFLLDEMLQQRVINSEEYKRLNNEIVSIASRREKDENIKKTIVEAIIQHDKKEAKDLLEDLKENLVGDFTDTLQGGRFMEER